MKLFYLSLGIIVIGLSLLLYLTAFIIVPLVSPEGSYPMILSFIPALPLIWLGWTLVKKARTTPLKCDAVSAEGKAQQMAL
jgi:threonine/homoserine/homoserine lactone efflux protein